MRTSLRLGLLVATAARSGAPAPDAAAPLAWTPPDRKWEARADDPDDPWLRDCGPSPGAVLAGTKPIPATGGGWVRPPPKPPFPLPPAGNPGAARCAEAATSAWTSLHAAKHVAGPAGDLAASYAIDEARQACLGLHRPTEETLERLSACAGRLRTVPPIGDFPTPRDLGRPEPALP